jgi:hypothetical protein
MQRVSVRTLALMVELLLAVLALQYMTVIGAVKADAVWLAGDCVVPVSAPAADFNDPTVL